MKIIVSAIALALAMPAAAQTAPAEQPRLVHSQHQQQPTAGHSGHAGHAGHQMPAGQQQGAEPGQQQGHAMGGDCCADRNGNGRMDCCENMAAGAGGGCCQGRGGGAGQQQSAQPQAHQNH